MKTNELMSRARASNPVPPPAWHDWTESPDGQALAERIVASPVEDAPTKRRALSPRSLLAAGTAVVLILGIFAGLSWRGSQPGTGPVWAAPVVAVAENAPRLLVGRAGWQVVRADEFGEDYGEMTFTAGEQTLDLHWIPGRLHDRSVRSVRSSSVRETRTTTIAGNEAVVFRYEGTPIFTGLWKDGRHSLEVSGSFADVDSFLSVVNTIEAVDVHTWLSAMPDSVVKPDGRAASVEEMLADIPVHPSVDIDKLKASELVVDRYQLGAKVTGAMACAWLDQWVTATSTGDTAAAQEAVNAMATSHDWAILDEMNSQGDWSEVVWEYADAMPANATVSGGRPMSIEESYGAALGCDY